MDLCDVDLSQNSLNCDLHKSTPCLMDNGEILDSQVLVLVETYGGNHPKL